MLHTVVTSGTTNQSKNLVSIEAVDCPQALSAYAAAKVGVLVGEGRGDIEAVQPSCEVSDQRKRHPTETARQPATALM